MFDVELIGEILKQILWSTETIAKRFALIKSPTDFVISDDGLEKLDAICMQLIALGESVKNLDKVTGGDLLKRYPDIEWKRIMGMRDILSHHYFDVDAEIVYAVCANHLDDLMRTVQAMLAELPQDE